MISVEQHSGYSPHVEHFLRYALAGCSSMTAAFITNPLDVVKIRMQLDNELATSSSGGRGVPAAFSGRRYKGLLRGCVRILHDEGPTGLLKGAPASIMREGIYGTIRMGSYEPLKKLLGGTDRRNTQLWIKVCAGSISGVLGSSITTPIDVVKVRMQAQGPGVPRRYHNTLSAFRDLFREGGLRGMFVGMSPNVQRAAVVSASQIPSYDHTKHTLIQRGLMEEGPALHIVSSMVAGFNTALATSPIDVVKTRIMNQLGHNLYRGPLDCFLKTLKSEGPLGFYKGFIPNWMRIGPHTIITFFLFEQFRRQAGLSPI